MAEKKAIDQTPTEEKDIEAGTEAGLTDIEAPAAEKNAEAGAADEKKARKAAAEAEWRRTETLRYEELAAAEDEIEAMRRDEREARRIRAEERREKALVSAKEGRIRMRTELAAKQLLREDKRSQKRREAIDSRRQERVEENETESRSVPETAYLAVYETLYTLGVRLIREYYYLRRRVKEYADWITGVLPDILRRRAAIAKAKRAARQKALLFPYKYIKRDTISAVEDIRRRRKSDEEAPEYRDTAKKYFRALGIPLNHIANFFAPLIGAAILAATILTFASFRFALAVNYSGQMIGYINNENEFYAAQEDMLGRLINEEYIAPEEIIPSFSLTFVSEDQITDVQTLSDRMISASGNEIASANGIYIEDEFLGAVEDGDEFLLYLDGILSGYRSGEENEVVQFVKTISLRNGVYPESSVLPLYQVKNTIGTTTSTKETWHTVEMGDTILGIASQYDTTSSKIYEMNPEVDPDYPVIRVGQKLLVAKDQVTSGLGIQVTRRETYEEEVDCPVTYVENDAYPAGYTAVISLGTKGLRSVTADVTYIDGIAVSVNELSSYIITEPIAQRSLLGTMPTYSSGKDNVDGFIWPVRYGRGYFNGSLGSYAGHTGMDIAVAWGSEVVASRGGYVEYATNWNIWPYGRQVYINHGNGVYTRYAHLSSVTVQTGQYVTQGMVIGNVGTSGNSTGPHLHFEIWVNNVYMAPERYIGYSG